MLAGALSYLALKLFSKYSNLCDQSRYLNVTDGQTDRRKDNILSHNRILRSIAR